MKAILISPEKQTIEEIQIEKQEDIADLIGYDTIESDVVGDNGDRLYFDEECFIRGIEGRFQIDNIVPVSGKGVIVGTAGEPATLADVVTELDDLYKRTKFL
ncbi:MAG: hypothetical protein WBO73_08070 [Gammaproteobacteria bacterium]